MTRMRSTLLLVMSLLLVACVGETPAGDGGAGGGGGATGGGAGGTDAGELPDASVDAGADDAGAPDAGWDKASPIPRGVWTRLDSGGGPWGAYFYRSVVLGNGDIWMGWGSPSDNPARGNFIFRAAEGRWTQTNTVAGDPTRNIGSRENYGAWFDADRGCVWIGDGAPVAYGFPNGPQCGELRYDVAEDRFTLAYPNFGPDAGVVSRGDGAFIAWQNALYGFGGWSIGAGQALRRRDLATGVVARIAEASTPPFTQPPARLTYARSGVNRRTGQLWTLADDGELYVIDPRATSPAWTLVATTGAKLGTAHFGAALHEATNTLVAYLGKDGMVGADNGPVVGETRLLDLSTGAWRVGPTRSSGDPVPAPAELASWVINEDPYNARVVVTVAGNLGTEVWGFVP